MTSVLVLGFPHMCLGMRQIILHCELSWSLFTESQESFESESLKNARNAKTISSISKFPYWLRKHRQCDRAFPGQYPWSKSRPLLGKSIIRSISSLALSRPILGIKRWHLLLREVDTSPEKPSSKNSKTKLTRPSRKTYFLSMTAVRYRTVMRHSQDISMKMYT